jgi:hypothetical protein
VGGGGGGVGEDGPGGGVGEDGPGGGVGEDEPGGGVGDPGCGGGAGSTEFAGVPVVTAEESEPPPPPPHPANEVAAKIATIDAAKPQLINLDCNNPAPFGGCFRSVGCVEFIY